MHSQELERLQARMQSVERRLQMMAVGWAVSLALVLLLTLMAQHTASQPQVVRTPAVEITDTTGRTRMTLDAVNGKPSLWLYDVAGRRRAGLTVSTFGTPEFSLHDTDGRARIALRVGYERAAELRLTDGASRTRIGLWVDYTNEPGLWLYDELVRPRIGLKVLSDGTPRLWLFEGATGRVLFSAP